MAGEKPPPSDGHCQGGYYGSVFGKPPGYMFGKHSMGINGTGPCSNRLPGGEYCRHPLCKESEKYNAMYPHICTNARPTNYKLNYIRGDIIHTFINGVCCNMTERGSVCGAPEPPEYMALAKQYSLIDHNQ